jgi:hypothetical protein
VRRDSCLRKCHHLHTQPLALSCLSKCHRASQPCSQYVSEKIIASALWCKLLVPAVKVVGVSRSLARVRALSPPLSLRLARRALQRNPSGSWRSRACRITRVETASSIVLQLACSISSSTSHHYDRHRHDKPPAAPTFNHLLTHSSLLRSVFCLFNHCRNYYATHTLFTHCMPTTDNRHPPTSEVDPSDYLGGVTVSGIGLAL